jgi:hypothetical protein
MSHLQIGALAFVAVWAAGSYLILTVRYWRRQQFWEMLGFAALAVATLISVSILIARFSGHTILAGPATSTFLLLPIIGIPPALFLRRSRVEVVTRV